MNISRKITFSLLISSLIFAAFASAAFTGFFDLVEIRFYHPRILRGLNREVLEDARVIGGLLDELRDRFAAAVGEDAVKRSFLPNPAAEDVFERSRIFGVLLNSLPGLRSVRFVDAGGSRIHFSTLTEDMFRRNGSSPDYRSYRDCPGVLPYAEVETAEGGPPRLIFDGPGERLIFSYPFGDTLGVYRGSALFTFSGRAVEERMIQKGRIRAGEDVSVVSFPRGFLLGLPGSDGESLKNQAAAVWEEGAFGLFELNGENPESLALISARYGDKDFGPRPAGGRPEAGTVFAGRLVRESIFVFPPLMKFILLGSFFLTAFLLVFLLFNLRQDRTAVINSRLKRLQDGLLRQGSGQKDLDWKHWARELEHRRGEVQAEITRDLPRKKKNSPVQAEIDALIDRSWDEVVAAIGKYPSAGPGEEELRAVIADVLRRSGCLPPESVPAEGLKGVDGSGHEAELLEELRPAEEAEVLEELEEMEEPDEGNPGEVVITPEAFAEEPEAELEPLEEIPDPQAPGGKKDLAALVSEIEFSPQEESGEEEGAAPLLNLFSPFDSLSFESPVFSGDGGKEAEPSAGGGVMDLGEPAKRNRTEGPQEAPGLVEITAEGGLPFICQPFLFRGNSKPLTLRPLEGQAAAPIREKDGLPIINSDILDPKLETLNRLDPKFLRLVKSIITDKAPG
jgi:hypothetical protein